MTQEEFVRRIRACGQAIVDHAEDIANNYEFQTDLEVSFHMDFGGDSYPRVEVISTFLPEDVVDKRFINHGAADNLQMKMFEEIDRNSVFIFSILGNN